MKTILLVEDDPFISDIYSSLLRKEGYKVDIANNHPMALEKIKNNYYDFLILDLQLDASSPGPKEGLDILKVIRQDPKTKKLKVVVLSNFNQKDYPELSELPYLGVVKFFLKAETHSEDIVNFIKEKIK